VAYRLRKPPAGESQQTILAAAIEPAGTDSVSPPAPTPDPAEPDPERRSAVVAAFSTFFSDLEPLLGDRWLGAWDRVKALAPPLASAIDEAEATADRVALDYMYGRAAWSDFESALTQHARVWQGAASALRASDARTDDRRCAECGRGDLTVLVFDDRGSAFCRACLKGHP
jgi:hypothetical protein